MWINTQWQLEANQILLTTMAKNAAFRANKHASATRLPFASYALPLSPMFTQHRPKNCHQSGEGGGGNSLLWHTALFLQATPGKGGGQKFFPYTYIQNFHEMWMFLAEWFVYCIESNMTSDKKCTLIF